MTRSTQSGTARRRTTAQHARTVAGVVLLAAFIAMVVTWTLFGFVPELAEEAPWPLSDFGRADAFWPILAGLIAGGGAAWALAPGLRLGSESGQGGGEGGIGLSPLAAAILGPASLVMMFAAYWPCGGHEQPMWAALRHAIEALEGYVAEPFGVVEGCPAGFPQGLMAGVLFGKATIVLVLGIGLAYVFRHSIDTIRARVAPQAILFWGLSEETAEIARTVAADLTDRQTLVVVDAGPELARARAFAAEAATRRDRAVALAVDASDPDTLEAFIRARGRKGVHGVYLMSPDSAANLRAMETVLRLDDELAGRREAPTNRQIGGPLWWRRMVRRIRPLPSEVPGRVVVRIDNPWHAEDWRRRQMLGRTGWLFDAVSVHAVAARHVVHRMTVAGDDWDAVSEVVIEGRSSFELALLTELAFERAADAALAAAAAQGEAIADAARAELLVRWRAARSGAPRVVLLGEYAEEAREHFERQLSRFGAASGSDAFRVAGGATRAELMARPGTALIVGEHSAEDPTLLSSAHPGWRIFAWSSQVHGLTRETLIGGLALVGPTLEPVAGYGVDIWERLGRLNHQMYLLRHYGGIPQVEDARSVDARGEWDIDLSPFSKEANIRPFAAVSRTLRAFGRTWATSLGEEGAPPEAPLDAVELLEAAVREHESWNSHHLEHAWRYGVPRDDAARVHDCLVAWGRLSPEIQGYDVESVEGALALFRSLGFTPVRHVTVSV